MIALIDGDCEELHSLQTARRWLQIVHHAVHGLLCRLCLAVSAIGPQAWRRLSPRGSAHSGSTATGALIWTSCWT